MTEKDANAKDITIYDIAEEAGVSPATVSRVLTQSAKVSQAKQEAVEKVIRKYKFRPNAMARSLSDTQSKVLGVIVADIRNPYYAALAVECEIAANRQGYTVIVCNALSDRKLEDMNLEKLYEQRVDAIIQIGCSVDDLVSDEGYVANVNRVSRTIPFVITGKLDGADCYRLSIDDNLAMDLVMEHLAGLGHRRIAFIGGARDVRSSYEKWQRFIYLLGKYDLEYREDFILEASYNHEEGRRATRQLLESVPAGQLPTAIIAVNDYAAVGIVEGLLQHGLSVPDDISVISFDNTFLCNIITPRLTSIDYNYPLFGERLVNIAIRASRKRAVQKEQIIVPSLAVRDSTGPVSKF
ncbi:MAG: LacI family DNA-binding transcriptional regulator [Oscillospiraceae bacterium]